MKAELINTPFGQMEIGATERTHLYVTTPTLFQWNRINNVEYSIHAHFYLWNDNQWHLGQQFKNDGTKLLDWERIHGALYLTKHNPKSYNDTYSEAARRKAIEVLPLVVAEWAKDHPTAILEAEVEYLDRQRETLLGEVAEAEKHLAELKAKLQGIETLYMTRKRTLNNPHLQPDTAS